MGYNLLVNGVYWGYNPFTNHLLTSWDIQVVPVESVSGKFREESNLWPMVVFGSRSKGGIGGIVHPPIVSIYHLYTTYILPFGGLYATYHLFYGNQKQPLVWSVGRSPIFYRCRLVFPFVAEIRCFIFPFLSARF